MTVKLVENFLASVNKLTFCKSPMVFGHIRYWVQQLPLTDVMSHPPICLRFDLCTWSLWCAINTFWYAINAVMWDITGCSITKFAIKAASPVSRHHSLWSVPSGEVPEPEMQFRFFAKLADTENNPTHLSRFPPTSNKFNSNLSEKARPSNWVPNMK